MANLDLPIGIVTLLLGIYMLSFLRISLSDLPLQSLWRVSQAPAKKAAHVEERETPGGSIEKESHFSSSWWEDEKIHQLERRAIFSKTWHYAAPLSVFRKPGDYLTLSIAAFSIFLILGKDGQLRGFHNVCRHRAYEVTRKECGRSTVLGCRYHGWSYDTLGRLTKAPEFEGVDGFEKGSNGLWEVKVRVVGNGAVFVNLDAGDVVEMEGMEGVEAEMRGWAFEDCEKVERWSVKGAFNWKLAVNVFDDCQLSSSKNAISWLWFLIKSLYKNQHPQIVHAWPLTTLHYEPYNNSWVSIKLIPSSAHKTTIQCELYAQRGSTRQNHGPIIANLKNGISTKLQELETAQNEAHGETLVMTAAQISHQERIHALLKAHLKLERVQGGEVHPAARQQSFSQMGKKDDDLCRQLEDNLTSIETTDEKGSFQSNSLDW
ncbi:MAG: hypothetical protein M1818_000108 [Claussenomyces sp. TS43310]|nr:MAG: hypothetical protein M1818_000108 [Claussenomyces sp. TS43310]